MKYRRDFVTNSSSSSFIVAYNSPAEMVRSLRKFASTYEDGYSSQYKTVVYLVFRNKITFTEALNHIKRIAKYDAEVHCGMIYEKIEKYGTYEAWTSSKEYKEKCKEYVNTQIAEFRKRVNPKAHIALLTFSNSNDDCYEVASDLDKMLDGVVYRMDIG